MSYAEIHPNWDREPEFITDGFSLEISAKYVDNLREAAPRIPELTPIAVTFLPGETLEACAVRECREELRITPKNLERAGELRFQFVDGYAIHVHVYRATD